MLRWAAIFFIIALVAGLFGFTGIAAGAASIAKILFMIFLVLFLVALIAGVTVGKKIIEWFGTSRKVYNETVNHLNLSKEQRQKHWMGAAKIILASLPVWAK